MMNRFFTLLLAASCLTAVGQVQGDTLLANWGGFFDLDTITRDDVLDLHPLEIRLGDHQESEFRIRSFKLGYARPTEYLSPNHRMVDSRGKEIEWMMLFLESKSASTNNWIDLTSEMRYTLESTLNQLNRIMFKDIVAEHVETSERVELQDVMLFVK